MSKMHNVLLKKIFEEESFTKSDIESFNNFVDYELKEIIKEEQNIEPTIIPHDLESFKIRFDKISVSKPELIEADGSKRILYPMEARLRKITYAAPIYLTVSAHANGVQKESIKVVIGNLPIMLKSKYCHLYNLSEEKLIEVGEDPKDTGGYFIINGSEKVLVKIEDLASNKFVVTKATTGTARYVGKIFSERGSFKIPHTVEKFKDGIFYLSFTRANRVPMILIIKALGLTNDQQIMHFVSSEEQFDEIMVNLYEFSDIKTREDALDFIAKKIGITQTRDLRIQRTEEILDRYLLPNVGTSPKERIYKAYNLCKFLRKYILISRGSVPEDDKDHYANKRVKMSGDLLAELFRVNFRVLTNDMLYNFQRIVKRGKIPSLKVIIREKLLTQRIYSSLATGVCVAGRKGISQRIQSLNFLETMSHLQRVVSLLSSAQENFEARELHPTHLGRLCPIETPEGTNIGLKKNLALLSSITSEHVDEKEVIKKLKEMGLKTIVEEE
jgi:DNA-directed RNA polymerase beta subunit